MMIARTKALYLFALTMLAGTNLLCMNMQKASSAVKPADRKYWLSDDGFKKAAQDFMASFKDWQPLYHQHNGLNTGAAAQASQKNIKTLKQRLEYCKKLCEQADKDFKNKNENENIDAKSILRCSYLNTDFDNKAALIPDPTQGDILWQFTHIVFPRMCEALCKKVDFKDYRAFLKKYSIFFNDQAVMQKDAAAVQMHVRCMIAYHLANKILLKIDQARTHCK